MVMGQIGAYTACKYRKHYITTTHVICSLINYPCFKVIYIHTRTCSGNIFIAQAMFFTDIDSYTQIPNGGQN